MAWLCPKCGYENKISDVPCFRCEYSAEQEAAIAHAEANPAPPPPDRKSEIKKELKSNWKLITKIAVIGIVSFAIFAAIMQVVFGTFDKPHEPAGPSTAETTIAPY